MHTQRFDSYSDDDNFSFCIARFMEQFGFKLSEHIYFLLSCSLWLNIRPSVNDHNSKEDGIICLETQNPYRCEYLSSAFACPYQYLNIDGENAISWVINRIDKKEPLLLEIPKSLVSGNGNMPSGDIRMVYAFVKSTHDSGPLSNDTAIELQINPSLRKTVSYKELIDFISRHPEVKGINYFVPLHLKSDMFLREMVIQCIIKQYYILYSCFHETCDRVIKNLKKALFRYEASSDTHFEHSLSLKQLNYDYLIEECPSLNREYYARSLQEAARIFNMDLSELAAVFHHNAIKWDDILYKAKNRKILSVDDTVFLYNAILSAEKTLLYDIRPVIETLTNS